MVACGHGWHFGGPCNERAEASVTGADLISAERTRQISAEGYDAAHDDEHENAELVAAAIWYADNGCEFDLGLTLPPWPFLAAEWKASDDGVRQLVKAGALIAAEVDRLLRAGAIVAPELQERCEGRYPVPQTAPPRDEPFDVTYRCALPTGHDGPHGWGPTSEEEAWIKIAAENARDAKVRLDAVTAQRDRLRAALAGIVGVDGRSELEQMEIFIRATPAPPEDKAATVDAIHQLIATLPEGA